MIPKWFFLALLYPVFLVATIPTGISNLPQTVRNENQSFSVSAPTPIIGNNTVSFLTSASNFTTFTLNPQERLATWTSPVFEKFTLSPALLPSNNFTLSTTIVVKNLTLPVFSFGSSPATPLFANTISTTPFVNACGQQICQPDQVCAFPLNGTSVCVKRLGDRRYCVDKPCSDGMKCFDNTTSRAYTCYKKLDGSIGECMGVQCSPGDICYQVMGQQAKCIKINREFILKVLCDQQITEAPKCLGQNEEFSPCKSGCESTCAEPSPMCMNSSTCTPGCSCIRGYVRLNGFCELMSECGSTTTGNVTCSGNEVYTSCKRPCEKTCSGVPSVDCVRSMSSSSTTINPPVCSPGCICRDAYKRHPGSGECIQARQCFQATTCSLNESWSGCHNCEPICGQAQNPSCKSCWSGCACDYGYSRANNGSCILTSQCK